MTNMLRNSVCPFISAHTRESGYPVEDYVRTTCALYALVPHFHGDERGGVL